MAAGPPNRACLNFYPAEMSIQTGHPPVPAQSGVMKELARSTDWRATGLGPRELWPAALEQCFALCLDSPLSMAVLWGPEFYLLYGDAYRPFLADRHPAALGHHASEGWPDVWECLKPQLARVFETGDGSATTLGRQVLLEHGGAAKRYFNYTFTPVRDAHGRVAGVLNTVHDVTLQVHAEHARQAAGSALELQSELPALSRELLQSLTDGAPDAIYVKDTAGRLVHVNDALCRLVNLSRSELIGRDNSHWLTPERAAAVTASDQAVMASRRSQSMEVEFGLCGPDGPDKRIYLSTKSPWIAPDGRLLGIFGISRDITASKCQEHALLELNQTLESRVAERTRERDRIWRVSRELLVVSNRSGVFVTVNPAVKRVLGWTFEEATRRPFLEMVHPDDVASARQEFENLLRGTTTLGFECRFQHQDGSYRRLNWTAVPEDDLVYAVARDITEEHANSQTLKLAEEQLRQSQKMEAVGQLTGGIAHDFNNLLATILNNLELLQRRVNAGQLDELPRYIATARKSAQRAASLTHRLLAFSRRQSLDPQELDLNTLVSSMAEMLQSTLGENVVLRTVLQSGLAHAFTDPNQLESALLNLTINARDAMPHGGTLTIETRLCEIDQRYASQQPGLLPGEYLLLSVTDTGLGMTPAVMAQAFEPFFTTKPIGQGTGLGLSMIYGYARQSGGHVAIESRPDKGTSVHLYLPPHRAQAVQQLVQPAGAAPQGAGESVLVVEDEPGVRMVVMEVLAELGYTAYDAIDAPSALALVDSGVHFDLLVSDVGLPGINGRQLADMVRMKRPGLKVLFITGYTSQATTRSDFLETGMDMLLKPFTIDELAHKIEDMLNRSTQDLPLHAL